MKYVSRLLLALFLTGASYIFLLTQWGEDLESLSYDSIFLLRGPRQSPENIVVIAIDESSLDQIDSRWPWPRSIHAKLVDKLREQGASVIGFDLLFAEYSDLENDKALADAINRHGKVVLVSELASSEDKQMGMNNFQQLVRPLPIMEQSEKELNLGLANISYDKDGFLRRMKCSQFEQNEMPALSMKIASIFSGKSYVCENTEPLINYIGPRTRVRTIPYYQALNPEENLPKDFLRDKIVLVGFSIASKADLEKGAIDHYPVPYSRAKGGVMPGVEVHATAVENFLNSSFIKEIDLEYVSKLGILLGIIGGAILFTVRPLIGFGLFGIIVISTLLSYFYYFSFKNVYFSLPSSMLPFAVCYIASPLFHYLTANKEKAFIKKAFSTYLNPKLVTQLIQSPDKLELGGEEREATVMFADLAGFTTLSETLSPKELVSFVNKYLGAFADEILNHDGMVDKYIGDCIMAVWGVPLFDEKHSEKACMAALTMKTRLAELNKETGKDISFRIGIASGQVLAGNVGGGTQFNYTVLGNDVNLASRIESLNKFYGTMLLVNERTKKALPQNLLTREVDIVRVKGQEQPERLFEVYAGDSSENVVKAFQAFKEAKTLYSEKKWLEAKSSFERIFEYLPNDKPSAVLIKRCEEFMKTPPSQSWDGVYVMTEK